jgi:hypothetical protein
VKVDTVRRYALSLADATEEPHFHFSSFRVGGKIFATMPPSNDLLHVFLPEEERLVAIRSHPDDCEVLHWGKRVVGLKIDLQGANAKFVKDLIRSAYEHKANQRKR